jgi:hypothetical protein
MSTVVTDKKKYVIVEQKAYDKLQLLAAQKNTPSKKMTLAAGRKKAYRMIDEWAKEK